MSRSRDLAAKVVFEALSILKENDGEMLGREVMKIAGERLTLDNWAREIYEKSGYIRWQSILNFFSLLVNRSKILFKFCNYHKVSKKLKKTIIFYMGIK